MDSSQDSELPPPHFYRALSMDAFQQSEINLAARENAVNEDELNEQQLRELYDNEEIDRFLRLFSAFVTEVQVPDTPLPNNRPTEPSKEYFNPDISSGSTSARSSLEDGDWAPVSTEPSETTHGTQVESSSGELRYDGLSEEIANRYLLPHLPPPRPVPQSFTIGRLRIAVERLYLAAFPGYNTFFSELIDLATWADYWTSFAYCLTFWILWWHNLLAPAFVLRILYGVLRRRLFSYPTLEDLRRHRDEVSSADEFGERVSTRLSASSSGVTEMWRLFKLFDNKRKNKAKAKGTDNGMKNDSSPDNTDTTSEYQEPTVLDTVDETEVSKDVKLISLRVLEDLADLHERIQNILIWRRPSASQRYSYILVGIFLLTLLPTQYIAKLALFFLGFTFWHVIPLIAALSPSDRSRIPPPLEDVPTDADYAMELISQRVAAGLEVQPTKKKQSKSHKISSSDSLVLETSSKPQQRSRNDSVDWKKWGSRLAIGKSAANDLRRLKPGSAWPVHEVWPPRHPLLPGVGIALPQSNVELHTYPCQHSSGPGLITLTSRALLFTPLMSQTAKLMIPLSAVKGIKKAGMLKGLQIRWTESINDGDKEVKEQKEDKFMWIGSRDELFARLVGSDGKKWMKV